MVALIGLSLGDSGFWFGFDIDTSPMQCMNVQIEDETEKSLFCEFSHCRYLSRGKFCLQHLSKVCKSQGRRCAAAMQTDWAPAPRQELAD